MQLPLITKSFCDLRLKKPLKQLIDTLWGFYSTMKHPYTRCFYFDQGSRSPVDVNNAVYLKHKKKALQFFYFGEKALNTPQGLF